MKLRYMSALVALGFASSVFACGVDDYIGSICTTSARSCPQGTLAADGRVLQVSQYQALYSVIGNYFGGDGKMTFALPDLRGRTPVGLNASHNLDEIISKGTKRGSESVTLGSDNMPVHTHGATFIPGNGTNPIVVNVPINPDEGTLTAPTSTTNYLSGSPGSGQGGNMWTTAPAPATVNLKGITVAGDKAFVELGTTGKSKPVSLIPPQVGMNYCINVQGTYPMMP